MRVAVGEVAGNARGWRLFAELVVDRVWTNHTDKADSVLHFQIISGRVESSGKGAKSRLNAKIKSSFAARLKGGIVNEFYLEEDVELGVANIERAIASAFQFDTSLKKGGESKERDINGACDVSYEPMADGSVRKVKRKCSWQGSESDAAVRISKVKWSNGEDGPSAVASDDSFSWALSLTTPRLKARSWLRLTRLSTDSLSEQWPTPTPPSLLLSSIEAQDSIATPNEQTNLSEAFKDARNWLELANEQGAITFSSEGLFALQRLVDAMLRAEEKHIDAIVRQDETLTKGLLLCLAACGSESCDRVAARVLRMRSAEPNLAEAEVYLMALQHEFVSEGARKQLSRYDAWAYGATEPQLWLSRVLERCEDEVCREKAIRMSIAWKCESCAQTFIHFASEGNCSFVRLSALTALTKLPSPTLSPFLSPLERIVLSLSRPSNLEERSLALSLLLSSSSAEAHRLSLSLLPIPLCEIVASLHSFAPVDLLFLSRSLLQWHSTHSQAMANHLSLCPSFVPLLRKGLSGALFRSLSLRFASLRFSSLQAMNGQALRFGLVSLQLDRHPLLDISLHTTGMNQLINSDDDQSQEDSDEPVSAHLSMSALGLAHWRWTLFQSQSGLFSAALQGLGSSPSTLLLSLRPIVREHRSISLSCGALLSLNASSSASLALSAHASASLWSRVATSDVTANARGVTYASMESRASVGVAKVILEANAHSNIKVSAHLDFYEGSSLCVRARTTPTDISWQWSVQGGSLVRGQLNSTLAGSTLSLGLESDALCTTMQANTQYDDEEHT